MTKLKIIATVDYSLCEPEIEDLEMELRSFLSTNEIKIEVEDENN